MWPQEVKMKVGDKLYCKEDFNKYFTAGKIYKIDSCKKRGIIVEDNYGVGVYVSLIDGLGMHEIGQVICIDQYFYTKKEIRKMKLEKLINVATK